MPDNKSRIDVEVAYAHVDEQRLVHLQVEYGTTVEQAIRLSGVLEAQPGINLTQLKVGVFSQICTLTKVLSAGDRVEIYRPLLIDPKEKRRQRALRPR